MENLFFTRKFTQKFVSGLILLAMLAGQIISLPVASAAIAEAAVAEAAVIKTASASVAEAAVANAASSKIESTEKPNVPNIVYDLVVLVVDVELDKDDTSYDGLKANYPEFANKLSDNKLGNRILRYAEDVRVNNELTDVKILFFDKQKDDVPSLANALENLYRNGDGINKNRLTGVVLIGDIPLPVVNKNGNRYISLFPYTDFSDKAYIFNEKTKSFERNNLVSFPKPEVWHGVMRAPSDNASGMQKLAEFFDKNHLYYEGEPMFARFDRKMFFGDLVHEEELLNPDLYKQYVKYLASLDDLAYFRYNKFWAAELMNQSMLALEEIPESVKVKGGFADSLKNANPLATLPDIYAKSIIDQNLPPYYQVLSKYIGKINDWSDYTARYVKSKDGGLNVDSVAGLIAIKDEYTKFYLKNVNDVLEKKVNQVAEKIQEPINLIDYSEMSGEIGNSSFVVNVANKSQPIPILADTIAYRFNYRNEEDGKMYLNGIAADVLNSPKQCLPLLGSTKSDYFDSQTLDFNPKAVGGKYSILTRSLRSDDVNTTSAVHTAGVNTRMLSPVSIGGQPSELYVATNKAYAGNANADGSYDTGAIVEDRPEYGISAFIHNPLYAQMDPNPNNSSYKGPLAAELQKGDVIVKVNGKNISYSNTFEQAIEESYANVKAVIDAVNKKKSDQLKNFPYQIKIVPGESLQQGNIVQAVGYFSVEFYRNGAPMTRYFSFTVSKDGLTNREDPQGDPEVYVLLDTPKDVDFSNANIYNVNAQGAIFTLYEGQKQGYNDRPYDGSAGCNANSTGKNGDRCFGMVATMPVLDVAGSLAPVIMNIPGLGERLKFPEKVKKNNQGINSSKAADYTKHVDSFQFPGGGQNDYYQYEDIDEVYYNACYSGLPSVISDAFTKDSNPFSFPLDNTTKGQSGVNNDISVDFYGRLLDSFGEFAASHLSNDPDYVEGAAPADSSDYNPKESIWLNLDKVDANQVILNDSPLVTLKDFSERYGLFDGKDDDGDGIIDYEWRDNDNDGVSETKFYDFDEANPQYGIPSWNLNEIARKFLSRDSIYTIPYGLDSFPYNNFDEDISLHVKAHSYKQISSTILHNEPTEFTISEQIKSQTAFSLPIDNPRYVALQTVAPGSIYKINYVNLFDPGVRNMAQLQAALISKADEIAALPGSYRVFGQNTKEGEYTLKQISDEILNHYLLLAVKNAVDDPVQGFNLKGASEAKIYDALKWLTSNIDEKHEYILRSYLNGDAKNQGNAYVNDATLLPAPAGFEPAYGYEAAYLVLNGDKDSFDLNFNKDLPPEKDGRFDPLSQILDGGVDGVDVDGGGDGGGGEVADEVGGGIGEAVSGEYEFVWVNDFLKEIKKFVNSLTTVPEFIEACSNFLESFKDEKEKEAGDKPINPPDPNANEVQLNSYVYEDSGDSMIADDESLMQIEAQIFNKEGNIEIEAVHKVKFSLSKDLASFVGSNVVESKNGVAVVYLKAGKKVGDFRIKAEVLKTDGVSVNKAYQIAEKDLHFLAGEPAKVEIAADSFVLVANNQSKTTVNIILRDKFDNIANDSFNSVAVFVNSIGKLDEKFDLNKELLGVQLGTFEGKANIDLTASDQTGEISLVAVVMDSELEEQLLESGDSWENVDFKKYIGSSETFKVLDKVSISAQVYDESFQPISAIPSAIPADGQSIAHIGVKLMNNGNPVKDYNGPIKFSILKENLGSFANKPAEKMINGQLNPANVTFKSSKLIGEEEILIEIPGFASDSIKFKTTANKASKIELIASENSIQTGDVDNEVILQARLLDENGNLIENNNGTVIEFKATASTQDLLTFEAGKSLTLNGVASTKVKGKNISGVANILAESEGLKTGIISLKIQKHVTNAEVKEFAPRALYISLLGGAFGKMNDANNLAQTLLASNGQVEAVTAITAGPSEKKRLFAVDGYGKIEFLTDTVKAKVMPATDSFPYQKIVLSEDMLNDELGSVFVVPKVDTPLMLIEPEKDIPEKEGIFVKILDPAGKDLFKEKDDGIYLGNEIDVKVKIDKYGRIFLNDDSYELSVPTLEDQLESSGFSLLLSKGAANMALINFRQIFNQNVKELAFDSGFKNFFPGVYAQPVSSKKKYQYISALSGYSSNEPKGVYMTDTENDIDSAQAPGFGYSSLENAKDEFGLGFEGNNKHMLLFAAGNSVGQSFLPYASDAGIIYGDPLIRLKIDDDLTSKNTGYTKDLGKAVFSGQEPIRHMVEFDVNGDGYDDLLLVYDDGLIRLLENEISNQRFRDRGYILNIYNGIFSLTKIDIDNDGYDDLIIGTKESCNAGEQCISLLKNTNGNFDRKSLNLALNDKKVYEMKSGDMNADGCEDLVTSDSSGDISIFYNKNDGESCQGLNTNYGYSKSFGYNINENLNQVDSLFVNYPGMGVQDNGIQFSLPSDQPPAEIVGPAEPEFTSAKYAKDAADLQNAVANSSGVATKDLPPQTFPKIFDFLHIKEDGKLALNSTKQSKDVNGGSLALGDEVEYLIALKNTSGTTINNLMLSDATPTSMTLLTDSLECMDAGCPDKFEWLETGTSLRSHIIKNISVPANGQRLIKYKMRIDMAPKVHFDIGNDFVKYPSNNNDVYLDIMVRPEVNPDGVLIYLYSTGLQNYSKMEVFPSDDSTDILDKTFKKMGLPSPSDLLSASDGQISPDLQNKLNNMAKKQSQDKDYNGCADSWNNVLTTSKTGGDAVASAVEGALGNLRCSGGGCAPTPYNYAFLTPDSNKGIPGFPAVNILSSLPYFVPFGPSTISSSVFRLYLSPTLTLGLGTAVCAGSGTGGAPCFAFAVPGGVPGVCDALQAGVNKALTASKNALVDPAVGLAAVITGGEGIGGEDAVITGGSFGDADDPISVNSKVNIKIPGFPSVVTNWMDNQIDEIYNKLLDFPTFYFILPDFSRVAKETKLAARNFNFKSFHDFAASISSFPFVKLESKEIVMKIPAISAKELLKYKYQAQAWIKHMENELEKYKLWKCEENEDRKVLCDKILLDIQNLISSVKKTMDTLDQIANLPKDILTWRNMEAKYATQIICYLDAIMGYTSGYINRQQKIIESWIKTIQDTIKTFKQWKLIMDVVAEYQQSCDKCKSDRFSKLALIMQLFAVIPDPPVLPLPKWPDFVVDFSQIKTGVTILWPDVVFRPEPIILPNLPTIVLPDLLPLDFKLDLSAPEFNFKLDLPDFLKFTMPNLPDLPTIPLPQLPDLPKPPRIPALPDAVAKLMINLKFIFKILCLLKNGLVPIPESFLGTEIETLTQPSVQAVLPFIKSLGMQYPPIGYSYVDQIRITGKLNFDIDTSMIYLLVEKGAEAWNENVGSFVRNINKYLAIPYGQWINNLLQSAVNRAAEEAKEKIKEKIKNESSLPLAYSPKINEELLPGLPGLEKFKLEMEEINAELNDYAAKVRKEQEASPETYYLTASQTFLAPDDPRLNRSLAEIENNIKMENLPQSPGVKQLADLRANLIAYTKNLNSSNAILEDIEDMDEFTKILADSDQSLDYIADSYTASDVGDVTAVKNETLKFSFFGQENENAIRGAAKNADLPGKRDLIAAAIDFSPEDFVQGGTAPAGGQGQSTPPPVGFFVGAGDVNENVLNYTEELKAETNILFNDVDHDNDYDIVFSMGGDVYLKTNHKNKPDLPKGDLIIGYADNTVADYFDEGGDSVQGLAVPYINNGKAEISWLKKGDDTRAYEIILRKSIYDDLENPAYSYKVNVADLTDKSAPILKVEIPNDNYYVTVFALDENEKRSLASDTTVVAPQSCADTEPPLPVISKTDYNVSIFKDVDVDASGSFDSDGKVSKYYLEVLPYESPLKSTQFQKFIWSDLNVLVDDDGDGITWNDRNNPKFKIGPFVSEGDIGKHEFILHVADQSGKDASMKIIVNVFAPGITLDETFARTAVATGETQPKVGALPFWLMRNRYIYRVIDRQLKLAPRIDKVKEDLTDDNGTYSINDFEMKDMIMVENANGEIVAEINPETGDIGKFKPGYKTVVHEAVPPKSSTSVDIIDPNGLVMGTIYLIADANIDVGVHEEFGFNAENSANLLGVQVDDVNIKDDFEFIKLPANDSSNPGGAILNYKPGNKPLVSIDTAGNIVILDSHIDLSQKLNNHEKDPLIVQINFDGDIVAEVYISTANAGIIVGPDDVPLTNPRKPSDGALNGALDGALNDSSGMNVTGVPDDLNYIIDSNFKFSDQDFVKRKDFVRVLLRMICIVPRDEAYKPFNTGTGYADNQDLDEYHPDIKEATLLGFVEGYKGEPDAAGLFPFKPENTINRAEAVKIILKALEFRGIVDLSAVKEGIPWHVYYMKAAKNLTPYLKTGAIPKANFIVTPEEALNPYKIMTFGELIAMVERVLEIYNCFQNDKDDDGMSDFCEAKYEIDDPQADQDNDGLNNKFECVYKLNPTDEDTDKGGVKDGKEIDLKTNPLDPSDDTKDEDNDGLSSLAETTIYKTDPFNPDTDGGGKNDGQEVKDCTDPLDAGDDDNGFSCNVDSEPGIYIVPAECNACPCIATFLHKADVIPGDVFFPVVGLEDKSYIFSKGNEVTIESVK